MGRKGRKTYQRPLSLFTKPGQVARLTLPDGFRFVVFVYDEPPTMVPINEPGSYEIDIPELLAKGRYPVGITAIDLAQVPAVSRLPIKAVNSMLDAMKTHAEKARG